MNKCIRAYYQNILVCFSVSHGVLANRLLQGRKVKQIHTKTLKDLPSAECFRHAAALSAAKSVA